MRSLVFLGATLVSFDSVAAMSEKDYLEALKFANTKVTEQLAKKNALQNNAFSLSSTLIKSLYGRYYQVGDQWDVAAWQMQNSAMRMIGDRHALKNSYSNGGVFHYEVVEVKTGIKPQVKIQVTQLESHGLSLQDKSVEKLILTMNDQMVQSEKTYFFKGKAQGVRVSPEGIRSGITNLELYPLDVPELYTADKKRNPKLPALPSPIQALATQVGFNPNLSQSFGFEQNDFFGRPIQVLWQYGDPWPSYFKTTAGIAILIRKGAK
jgi:hypothetical protein